MRSSTLALLLTCTLLAVSLVHAEAETFGFLDECIFTRQIDGRCNNIFNHELGAPDKYLKRGAEGAFYVDGVREPYLFPNARTVSNELFRSDDSLRSEHGLNGLWVFFGQFVTHDLMGVHRVGDLNASALADNNLRIFVPLEQPDDQFILQGIANPTLRIIKSRGEIVNGQFEVGSDATAWLDLSPIYGNHINVTNRLRSFSNGELITRLFNNYTAFDGSIIPPSQATAPDFGEWMPLLEDVDPNREEIPVSNQLVPTFARNVIQRFFATGDGRNGESFNLNMLHGMFLREHNRLAREIKASKPWLSDEFIFQRARKINIAQYQAIVYHEYLPSLLLSEINRVGNYDGYDIHADPTLTQLFAFAFRFGHTTVPQGFFLRDACNQRPFGTDRDGPRGGQGNTQQMPADQLAQVGRAENVLHALLFEASRPVDIQFPETLRTIPAPAFVDVIVQNQIRTAENGIPPYHYIRKLWYGGPKADLYSRPGCNAASETSPSPDPIECFNCITANATVASKLQTLFGKLTQLNFYVAVVAEDPEQSVVGRTSARIIADQFKRVRDADRWYFESEFSGFTPRQKRDLKRDMKIAVLLRRNFPTMNVQDDAFYIPDADHFASCPSV